MTDAALALTHVTKRYGAFTAVDDLSFTAPRGRILGFAAGIGALAGLVAAVLGQKVGL